MKKRTVMYTAIIALILLSTSAFAYPASQKPSKSVARVYWNWDVAAQENSVGVSVLSRQPNQIRANYFTSELPADQAMTLWFIVFNYPELCTEEEGGCSFDDMGANAAAQGDFLVADGRVTKQYGYTWFRGRLAVDDTSGSGLAELSEEGCIAGYEGCGGPIGLVNPEGAVVNLAVHSHGPVLSGQELADQLTSFTGGCEEFLGAGGFAGHPGEVPDSAGECSTIQQSIHLP